MYDYVTTHRQISRPGFPPRLQGMNTRHAVIDSPLGELTVVAEDDALTGLYFPHHWYRPADGIRGRAHTQTPLAGIGGAECEEGGEVVLMTPTKWQKRVDSGDWDAITAEVNDFGGALLPRLVTKSEAEKIRGLYSDDHLF